MSSASGCLDPATLYQHIDCGQSTPRTLQDMAWTRHGSFLRPITEKCPLKELQLSVYKKMLSLNPSKAIGPDGVPSWLLKENADLFAQPVADILI